MNKLNLFFVVSCVAAIVGCTPEAVPMTTVETMTRLVAYDGDLVSIYGMGVEQQSLLRNEFETWKRAGFEGFDESFITRVPTLLITGTTTNGVSYTIDFGQEQVMVKEVEGTLVDGSQYARDMTEADKRFRQFLLVCIADGRLPRIARGKLPKPE